MRAMGSTHMGDGLPAGTSSAEAHGRGEGDHDWGETGPRCRSARALAPATALSRHGLGTVT